MAVKPGYKHSEVGVIPEDWKVASIGQLTVKVGSGITPRGGQRVYRSYGRPFMRSQNVGWGNLLLGDVAFIDDATHSTFAETEIQPGDVFLNITGASIGRSAVADTRLIGGNVNQHVCIIRADERELVPRFLNLFLLSAGGQRQIDSFQAGGNRQGLNFRQVRSICVPIPPTNAEQRAIADALSDVDSLLGGLDQLIAKKRNLLTGAMLRLLTGEIRLPGFTDPWQEKRLGDHVSFLRNGVHSRAQLTINDPVCYLHYGDIHVSSSLRLDLRRATMPRLPAAAAARLTRLEDGDVVFVDASEDLLGVGKSLEIEGASGIEAVAGQHTIAARFDKQVLADGFKGYLQFVPAFNAHLRRLAAGTKVYATNRKHIASAEIALPEPDEQRAIARVLFDMEAEIAALEARLAKTRDLKQAMMQALLTGRVRLPVPAVETCEPEAAHA
jgi:type I restriction enzyme S subunit